MNWFKNIGKNKNPKGIKTYSDFWKWFLTKEARFFQTIKSHKNVERDFINHLSVALKQLNEDFYFVVGMMNDDTAELVITAEGDFRIIPYVEDLIAAAPNLSNWKFTAHKSPNEPSFSVSMEGHEFNQESIQFAVNEHEAYPDEIDLTFVYKHFREEEAQLITNGVFIFLDNYLGEIRAITSIDKAEVVGPEQVQKELISIAKLEDYLIWREKEFIEKYEGVRYNTEEDTYGILEATTQSGAPILAALNSALLKWDRKASHPWMIQIEIPYDGSTQNGMPDESTYQAMGQLEECLLAELKDHEGYLNIGRETGRNVRTIFFACKDFRKPVRMFDPAKAQFPQLRPMLEIFRDKYWRSLSRFSDAIK